MASTYKTCNCPGCFETVVGDTEGVDLCDDCEAADCDPFGDVEKAQCNHLDMAGEYLHAGDVAACIEANNHLKSVDRDGYCNACGHQPEEE